MPKNNTPSSGSDNIPAPSYKPSQQLITAIHGIPTAQAKEQAAKLLDGARYLNHTGVMLGDHRRVAASHYLNMMLRALFNELEHSHPAPQLTGSNATPVRTQSVTQFKLGRTECSQPSPSAPTARSITLCCY